MTFICTGDLAYVLGPKSQFEGTMPETPSVLMLQVAARANFWDDFVAGAK